MPLFTRSILIRAPIEKLYAFHLDTNNARLIQPPGFTVVEVAMPPEPRVGGEIRLVIRVMGLLRQTWRVRWAELQPPSGDPPRSKVVDMAMEAPFPFFRHEHLFEREADATRLTDRITFEPPFGRPGYLLLPFIHLNFLAVFWWRQRVTRQLLEAAT